MPPRLLPRMDGSVDSEDDTDPTSYADLLRGGPGTTLTTRGTAGTDGVSAPTTTRSNYNTQGGLEQHLSTGAQGRPFSIRQSADSKPDVYGNWAGAAGSVPLGPGQTPNPAGGPSNITRGSTPSGGGTRTSFAAATPAPRAPYGTFTTNDLNARTIQTGAGLRLDPYSGQKYQQSPTDMTWRTAGFEPRENVQAIIAQNGLPPISSSQINPTSENIAMSANPGLRQGAGLAGTQGTLQPTDAPHFQTLGDYRMPGLGFNAADYRPMNTPDMSNVKLPTPVAQRPYGQDFGAGAPGAKTYGPSEVAPAAQRFQVPNDYQAGPSGFSIPDNGGAFKAFAMPFGISSPSLPGITGTAPASLTPTGGRDQYNRFAYSPVSNDVGPVTPLAPGPVGSVGRPGGAGAAWLTGPQNLELRGGGIGTGINTDTILKDYGRSGLSQDAATRAQMALSLYDKNNELQRAGMSPLDAYMAMNTPSATNYGAPAGSFGNEGNPGAYGPDGPDRGFAKGGMVDTMPTMPTAAPAPVAPMGRLPMGAIGGAPAAPLASAAPAQASPSGANNQPAAPYINSTAALQTPSNSEGAIAPVASSPPGIHATPPAPPPPGQAPPGIHATPPAPDTLINGPGFGFNTGAMDTGAAAQGGMAGGNMPSDTGGNPPGSVGGNMPPGGDVLQPYQDALVRLGILNRQRQKDASRYRAGGLNAPTAVDTLGSSGGVLPPGMYFDPSKQIQGRISDITGLQETLTGLGDPGSVEELSGQQVPLQHIQALFGDIQKQQEALAAMGNVGSADEYNARLNTLQDTIKRYNDAKTAQRTLAGLGTVADPGDTAGLIASKKQELQPWQQVADMITQQKIIKSQLTSPNPETVQNQLNHVQLLLSQLTPSVDIYGNPTMGGLQDPSTGQWVDGGALQQQETTLKRELSKWQDFVDMDGAIKALDPTGKATGEVGRITAEMDDLQRARGNYDTYAKSRDEQQNLIKSIFPDGIPEGTNIDQLISGAQTEQNTVGSKLANVGKAEEARRNLANLQGQTGGETEEGVSAKLTNLQDAISRSRKKGEASTQLQNLLSQGVPGAGKFNKGGKVSTAPGQMGFARKSMTTNEPIIGVGAMTGAKKFIVGEPVTPGGPPRKERLSIKPLHQNASLPMGKIRRAA